MALHRANPSLNISEWKSALQGVDHLVLRCSVVSHAERGVWKPRNRVPDVSGLEGRSAIACRGRVDPAGASERGGRCVDEGEFPTAARPETSAAEESNVPGAASKGEAAWHVEGDHFPSASGKRSGVARIQLRPCRPRLCCIPSVQLGSKVEALRTRQNALGQAHKQSESMFQGSMGIAIQAELPVIMWQAGNQ